MKKLKKVFAVLLSVAMILGMSTTVFAEDQPGTNPSPQDTDKIQVLNLKEGDIANFYKIVEGKYVGGAFDGYKVVDAYKDIISVNGKDSQTIFAPTSTQIQQIAQKIANENISSTYTKTAQGTTASVEFNGAAEKKLAVGTYLVLVTPVASTSKEESIVYNPMIVSVYYTKNGVVAWEVNAHDQFKVEGKDVYAKHSPVKLVKEVTNATMDGDHPTASIGKVLNYELKPTIPSYPEGAKNKTFFISDFMSKGLTFDFQSLTIEVGVGDDKKVYAMKDSTGDFYLKEGNTWGTEVVAHAAQGTSEKEGKEDWTGFRLDIDYDKVVNNPAVIPNIVVKYNAVVNEDAVVGKDGNPNDAYLYYAKDPNQGEKWTNVNKDPDNADVYGNKEDNKTVITYQLAFRKTGDDDEVLPGAVFGIYRSGNVDEKTVDESTLATVVTTNEEGYGITDKVEAGDYYIKEIQAPDGYSLNENVYHVKATWNEVTSIVEKSSTKTHYITKDNPTDLDKQVGWIKEGKFYALDTYKNEADASADSAQKAYIEYVENGSETETSVIKNQGAGAGAVELGDAIPNTSLANLPSTGGIGTIIFTVGGCLIMVVAAALYFANRRRSANSESK